MADVVEGMMHVMLIVQDKKKFIKRGVEACHCGDIKQPVKTDVVA